MSADTQPKDAEPLHARSDQDVPVPPDREPEPPVKEPPSNPVDFPGAPVEEPGPTPPRHL